MADRSAELSDAQLARIRLVTRRYHELQGLGTCWHGLSLVLCGLVIAPEAPQGEWGFLVPLGILMVLGIAGQKLAGEYYQRRFGRVAQQSQLDRTDGRFFWIMFLASFAAVAGEQFGGPPFAAFIFFSLAGYWTWRLAADWPFRPYLLFVVAGALAGAFYVWLTVGPAGDAAPLFWDAYWTAMTFVGLSYMFVGLLDHRLLMATLHGVPGTAGEVDHADSV